MGAQAGTTYGTQFEFEATGVRLYSGTGDPNGAVSGRVGDIYFRIDCSMTVPPIYSKMSGTNTTTGWVPVAGGGVVSTITIAPQTGELTIQGYTSSGVETGELVLQGNQPGVIQAHTIAPSTGALVLTGTAIHTPWLQSGSLTLTGNQPTVVVA